MEPKVVSINQQAWVELETMFKDQSNSCELSQQLALDLLLRLSAYREEGEELSPIVVITDDLSAMLAGLPGAQSVAIGTSKQNIAKEILKNGAPVALGGWHIFIQKNGDAFEYGVFSFLETPKSVQLDEHLNDSDGYFFLRMQKIGESAVLVRSRTQIMTVCFTEKGSPALALEQVKIFCDQLISSAPASDEKDAFSKYFAALIFRVLSSSHGTIFVCEEPQDDPDYQLSDAVNLSPEIDFAAAFEEFRANEDATSILNLNRYEQLLLGFAKSDGIVVFTTSGKVKAYRAFFVNDTVSNEGASVVGGARTRAYEGLKLKLGRSLKSVLFRSQDGTTLCEVSDGR